MHPEVQRLLDGLDRSSPVARSRADEIAAAVTSSPYLQDRMRAAVRDGTLERIEVGSRANEGGHYDDGTNTVSLARSLFETPSTRERRDGLTFVLGHEVGHALMQGQSDHKSAAFRLEVNNLLAAPADERVDATALVGRYLERSSVDESTAEVVGWNALQSRVAAESKGHVGVAELLERAYRFTSCVASDADGALTVAPGVALQPDGRILVKDRPQQLDAVGECHFETGANLGPKGDASYRNYYGAYAISSIAVAALSQRRLGMSVPDVELDFAKLGLRPATLSSAGLDFDGHGHKFTMWDVSRSRAGSPVEFTSAAEPKRQEAPEAVKVDGIRADPLFQSVVAGVSRLYASLRRESDEASERMTASLYSLAKHNGLTHVDHVVLSIDSAAVRAGENAFIVQGGMHDSTNRVAHMKTEAALSTPAADSLTRAEAMQRIEPAQQPANPSTPEQRPAVLAR